MKIMQLHAYPTSTSAKKTTNNKQISFKSSNIEEFNNKYKSIKTILQKETEEFIKTGNNVTKLGEGIAGITYQFNHPSLRQFVIKKNKPQHFDTYAKEYKNLSIIPTNIIDGQEGIARIENNGNYYLVSTLVQGSSASKNNRYTDAHLKNLFQKMFELDKLGIYHGDLNCSNILLNPNGKINFIDYQWTEKVNKVNFFDSTKSEKILLPISTFPENAQMFEMASMPWYMDTFNYKSDREEFIKKYLEAKSNYHENRYNYIKSITKDWPYQSEIERIKTTLDREKAKSQIYKNPTEDVLILEMKKLQFLSDYRHAYAHVDPNIPTRNILAAPSSYLCSISAIQDFRKEVQNQLRNTTDKTKFDYLNDLADYGNYWYTNLTNYTENTYNYIMRMALKNGNYRESQHKFYTNDRNPRIFTPNIDLLGNMWSSYQTNFDAGLDKPEMLYSKIIDLYETPIDTLNSELIDSKSQHKIAKLEGLFKKSKKTSFDDKLLDTLNISEVAVLKIREFQSYVKHNISSYDANKALNNLLIDATHFSRNLFRTIFSGLKSNSADEIVRKGYTGMRNFIFKV